MCACDEELSCFKCAYALKVDTHHVHDNLIDLPECATLMLRKLCMCAEPCVSVTVLQMGVNSTKAGS